MVHTSHSSYISYISYILSHFGNFSYILLYFDIFSYILLCFKIFLWKKIIMVIFSFLQWNMYKLLLLPSFLMFLVGPRQVLKWAGGIDVNSGLIQSGKSGKIIYFWCVVRESQGTENEIEKKSGKVRKIFFCHTFMFK